MKFGTAAKYLLARLELCHDLNDVLKEARNWRKDDNEDSKVSPDNRTTAENLKKRAKYPCQYKLDPCLAITLESMVRGGLHRFTEDSMVVTETGVGQGQITNMIFISFANLAHEAYSVDSSSTILSMLLEHIGKDVDSELVQVKLKDKMDTVLARACFPGLSLVMPQWIDMITSEKLGQSMFILRKGALAFIEKHKSHMQWMVPKMKGQKLRSNRHEMKAAIGGMFGGDNKSITLENMGRELIHDVNVAGRVTIVREEGIKRIEVDPTFNRIYVQWLLDDVIHTLDWGDAKKGSLGKFHRLNQWEIELTSRIHVSKHRLSLDISEDFEPYSWVEGLLTTDLNIIADVPGVDVDRRILRIAFFSEIAWRFALDCLDKAPSSDGLDAKKKSDRRKLKAGKKVIVHSLSDIDNSSGVVNGMQGKIVEQQDEDHYAVAFTNLATPQVLHKSNIQKTGKMVSREFIACMCGKESDFVCSRCGRTWYCSKQCQLDDKQRHKAICDFNIHGLFHSVTSEHFRSLKVSGDSKESESDAEEDHSL